MPQQPSPCALRPAVAAQKLGIGLSTLRGKAKNESGFPRPVKTGPRVTSFSNTIWMRGSLHAPQRATLEGGT